MILKKLLILTFAITGLLSSGLNAATITPADMTGLRSFDAGVNVLLLTFDAVKTGTEDRTIAHFDISTLSGATLSAVLEIPINNIDPGLPAGTFDVYSFTGDGIVSIDEWNAGVLEQAFTGIEGGNQTLSLDITTLLLNSISNNDTYLSFNFRGGVGTDRYWLSDINGLPDPVINTIVPVPAAVWLFVGGMGMLFGFSVRKNIS